MGVKSTHKPLALVVREKIEQRLSLLGVDVMGEMKASIDFYKSIADDVDQMPEVRIRARCELDKITREFFNKTIPSPKSVDIETGKSEGITIQYLDMRRDRVEDAAKQAIEVIEEGDNENSSD